MSLSQIEQRSGGRLGVMALDPSTGRILHHRADERFAMCSTFKLISVDSGQENLDRRIAFSEKDLLEYAPVTSKKVKEKGMTVRELCAAVLEWSDNTAANLLLKESGGPTGLTQIRLSQVRISTPLLPGAWPTRLKNLCFRRLSQLHRKIY